MGIQEKKDTSVVSQIDKDKDVYLKELKNLERKHQLMDEELKTTLLYTRITLFLTVIVAFMMVLQLYYGNASCHTDHETLHSQATDAMTLPNLDTSESNSNNEL